MDNFDENRSKIKTVEFALRSFADYGNNEEERRNYLRQNFKEHPELKTYLRFTEIALKDHLKQLQEMEDLLLAQRARTSDSLVEFLKTRLSEMTESAKVVELSPLGGMRGQQEKLFGKKLYGIDEVAEEVARLAGDTFACFSKKVPANKTAYVMGAILSGKGTGKSSFLDRHVSLILEHCWNKELKELLKPEGHPLVLNITFNSGSTFSLVEAADSGAASIAKRLAFAYTDETQKLWDDFVMKTVGPGGLKQVLSLIVDHHKKVNKIEAGKKIVVVINVDELNQVHSKLAASGKEEAFVDLRVNEIAVALRSLTMTGVTGCAVICLLAGTAVNAFAKALKGSGIEFIAAGLPLLKSSEIVTIMRECKVDERYLSDPSFQLLLDDTGGVPRVLRKVLEGLTAQYSETSIQEARYDAVKYIKMGTNEPTPAEKLALIPYVVFGKPVPTMAGKLVPESTLTFEDLRMAGIVFVEDGQLAMPVLFLQALFSTRDFRDILIQRLIFWYGERRREGFEMFCALFHSLKMKHLASESSEVSMANFYSGVTMHPEIASLPIKLSKNADYEVSGSPREIRTYRFPGQDAEQNKSALDMLKSGQILRNGSPSGDCIIVDNDSQLVRSLCVAHAVDEFSLSPAKIENDNQKAVIAFQAYGPLSKAKVVTVHITNRPLGKDVVPDMTTNAIVIGRESIRNFFGPSFYRGLLSPTFATKLREADKREYYTLTNVSRRSRRFLSRSSRVAQTSLTDLRWVRYFIRGL